MKIIKQQPKFKVATPLVRLLLLTPLVLTIQACGGGSSSTIGNSNTNTDTNTNTNTGGSSTTTPTNDPATVDITEVIFSERSADCASYANSYSANVTDITNGNGFDADVTISNSDNYCTLTSNGIPNHHFNDTSAHFATQVATQSLSYQIKRNPVAAASPTALSQQVVNAIMLNGVILDLLSAGCYDPSSPQASDGSLGDDAGITPIGCQDTHPWLADPLGVFHHFGADEHNAHTQPGGEYHYHGDPNAMFDSNPGAEGSPVIGFAADGFPIYGSYFYDSVSGAVREARSGYSLKAVREDVAGYTTPPGLPDGKYIADYEFTNAGDLDQCNGMTINGQYGYYVTSEYPWVMNCYVGTPDVSFQKSMP